jgi:hypothetical protein
VTVGVPAAVFGKTNRLIRVRDEPLLSSSVSMNADQEPFTLSAIDVVEARVLLHTDTATSVLPARTALLNVPAIVVALVEPLGVSMNLIWRTDDIYCTAAIHISALCAGVAVQVML